MRELLSLISIAKNQGAIPYFKNLSTNEPESVSLDFLDTILSDIKPMVFEPPALALGMTGVPQKSQSGAFGEIIEAAPFKTFSAEYLGDKAMLDFAGQALLMCVIVHEVNPCEFNYIALLEEKTGERFVAIYKYGYSELIDQLLSRIKTEAVGLISDRQRLRVSNKSRKRTVSQIIYIGPQKVNTVSLRGAIKGVDYSHRWGVRGHWRKISGLGKDRLGNYCVNGFTWVSEHVKGPEEKELVSKVRFIKGE